MNMYAKFWLHLPHGFWGEEFWFFFSKIYPLCCHGNHSNSAIWTKFIWIVEDYSWKIYVEKNLNICSETAKIATFYFSHYMSMETISCLSYSFPPSPPIDAIWEIWKESASRLQRRSRLKMLTDDGRTDDGRRRMPAYTISAPMSKAQVS